MKIIEAQNALLSNYELYQHLVDQKKRNKEARRRVPGNLATMSNEMISYFRRKPGPFSNQEKTGAYHEGSFAEFFARVGDENLDGKLSKAEVLTIFNLRPCSIPVLSTMVEDLEGRFGEDEQKRLLRAIAEVLGQNEPTIDEQEVLQSTENGH
ncbi:hypothetical protein OQA88_12305 [Cercophora sp. LCS_1]